METEVWAEVDKARGETADLLDSLSEEQWATQSLCEQWTVRDVVGHLVLDTRPTKVFPGLLANGFNFDRWMARASRVAAKRPTDELVGALRDMIGSRRTPPFTKPTDVLTDTVVHTQDIRRPLHIETGPPLDRIRMVADFVKDHRFYKSARKRAGLRLRATDTDWSVGDGPVVEGPLEAIVMALLGRKSACDELVGEGVETLRSRL